MFEPATVDSLLQEDEETRVTRPVDSETYWSTVEERAMVAITSRRGSIVYVNDWFCEISGYARRELIGVTHRRVNSGRHPHPFWRDVWQTIGAGRVWQGEICNGRHDGSQYWVESVIRPMRRSGGILGYVAVSRLIGDTRQANGQQPRLENPHAVPRPILSSIDYTMSTLQGRSYSRR